MKHLPLFLECKIPKKISLDNIEISVKLCRGEESQIEWDKKLTVLDNFLRQSRCFNSVKQEKNSIILFLSS